MTPERFGSMAYEAARRQARVNYGENAEVEYAKGAAFPYRVGVKLRGRLHYLGVGTTWDEAFVDALRRANVAPPPMVWLGEKS